MRGGVDLDSICISDDRGQFEISKKIIDFVCTNQTMFTNQNIYAGCEDLTRDLVADLLNKGWTRKEFNFLAYHVVFNNNINSGDNKLRDDSHDFMIFTFYSSIRVTKPTSRTEFLNLINNSVTKTFLPNRIPPTILEGGPRGCENLFNLPPTNPNPAETEESPAEAGESTTQAEESATQTEESNTEAGTECVDCQMTHLNSEMDFFKEQIASLKHRLNRLQIEKNQKSITCTKNDGSSFNVKVGSDFACPQHRFPGTVCTRCYMERVSLEIGGFRVQSICSYQSRITENTTWIPEDDTSSKLVLEFGITCKLNEQNTSTQNQKPGNSPSNR